MLALYAATMAALEVFSEGLRDELRSDGIRVTILRSGAVDGTTGANHWSEETRVAFHTFLTKSGHANFAGIPATPQSMAQALHRFAPASPRRRPASCRTTCVRPHLHH